MVFWKLACRARPLIARELLEGSRACVFVDEGSKCVTLGQERRFTFDHVFGASATQVSQAAEHTRHTALWFSSYQQECYVVMPGSHKTGNHRTMFTGNVWQTWWSHALMATMQQSWLMARLDQVIYGGLLQPSFPNYICTQQCSLILQARHLPWGHAVTCTLVKKTWA